MANVDLVKEAMMKKNEEITQREMKIQQQGEVKYIHDTKGSDLMKANKKRMKELNKLND